MNILQFEFLVGAIWNAGGFDFSQSLCSFFADVVVAAVYIDGGKRERKHGLKDLLMSRDLA